jgi:hypothetical protein
MTVAHAPMPPLPCRSAQFEPLLADMELLAGPALCAAAPHLQAAGGPNLGVQQVEQLLGFLAAQGKPRLLQCLMSALQTGRAGAGVEAAGESAAGEGQQQRQDRPSGASPMSPATSVVGVGELLGRAGDVWAGGRQLAARARAAAWRARCRCSLRLRRTRGRPTTCTTPPQQRPGHPCTPQSRPRPRSPPAAAWRRPQPRRLPGLVLPRWRLICWAPRLQRPAPARGGSSQGGARIHRTGPCKCGAALVTAPVAPPHSPPPHSTGLPSPPRVAGGCATRAWASARRTRRPPTWQPRTAGWSASTCGRVWGKGGGAGAAP